MSFGRRVSKVVLYADLSEAGLDGSWRAGKRRSSSGDGGVGAILLIVRTWSRDGDDVILTVVSNIYVDNAEL